MDNYIHDLARRHSGIAQAVTPRDNGAIAILMEDGRKVEFTSGEVLSAQMKEHAREYNEKIETAKEKKAAERKEQRAVGPKEPARPTKPAKVDSAEV